MTQHSIRCLLMILCISPVWGGRPGLAGDLDSLVRAKSLKVQQAFQEKDYAQAVALLEEVRLIPGLQDDPWSWSGTLYNLACGYSRLNRKDEALSTLQQAAEAGFSDWEHVLKDEDLGGLREDAHFAQIVERMKADASLWDSPALRTPYRESLSEEERIAGLSRIWSEVKYNFAYFDRAAGVNWDSLYLAYLPRAQQANRTRDYYLVLEEFSARLHDGHTSVDVPGELFLDMYSRPPLDTRLIEGRVLVVEVLKDSLRKAGVRPGMEILRVDGIPVHEYAEKQVAPYVSASTTQGREADVYGLYLLCGSSTQPVRLELRDEKERVTEKSLPRSTHRILSWTKPVEFRLLKGRVAYVALNSLGSDEIVAAFDSLYPQIEKARALILDVRQNSGGNSSVGWQILGYLTDRPFATGRWSTRDYRASLRAGGFATFWHTTQGPLWQPHPSRHFTGRVVVLTSSLTGSAAEDFCMAFDVMKRGKMIGDKTCGSTGQPIMFALPGGGSGRVCAARTAYPDGTEYVGRGILPDLEVLPTAADIRAGRDAALEAALAEFDRTDSQ